MQRKFSIKMLYELVYMRAYELFGESKLIPENIRVLLKSKTYKAECKQKAISNTLKISGKISKAVTFVSTIADQIIVKPVSSVSKSIVSTTNNVVEFISNSIEKASKVVLSVFNKKSTNNR